MDLNTKPIRYLAAFAGALLLVWERIWWFIEVWSNIDFVSQKAGGMMSIAAFLASPLVGNIAGLLGVALLVMAFVMVERRATYSATLDQPKPFSVRASDTDKAEEKILEAIFCGTFHVGADKVKNAWTEGPYPAAILTVKNVSTELLRAVDAHAEFFDDSGKKLALELPLSWIDEPANNVGIAPDQERSLLIAIQRKGSSGYFGLPSDINSEFPADHITADLTVHWRGGGTRFSISLRVKPHLLITLTP